jgi:aspartyl/glutamyl-tRNA(Asn/Gln) amidotransferase C subunit
MPEKEQAISPEVFDHLVKLAALELDEKQAEYLRRELNNQLSAIRELEAIPVGEDIPISLHGVPYEVAGSAVPREDSWLKYPDADDILEQAPRVEDGYIIVPDIPHTTLE